MTQTAWIVDDDREMAEAIGLMLKLLGWEHRIFLSGQAAGRALLQGPPPAVILLDLNMPVVPGDEFLKFVRSRRRWDAVRVFMLTSEFAETERERLLALGANGYLTKPVALDELEQALGEG